MDVPTKPAVYRRPLLAFALLTLAALPACGGGTPKSGANPGESTPASTPVTPTRSASGKASAGATAKPKATPSPSVTANPLPSGPATQGCVHGWVAPKRGTKLRSFPLDLLRQSQGFKGEFVVHDLRHFTGPDDTSLAGDSKAPVVERWYGKITYSKDPSFRLRFMVRRTPVGSGIFAIAPFDTKGYSMADWRGFDGEGGSSTFPGLPGKWPGVPTDYAGGGGLPAEVARCIAE